MDLVLEYILSDARGLLRLRPFVLGFYGRRFSRFWGSAMLIRLWEAMGCIPSGTWVSALGQ
jgi:hypothetical protein